MTNTDFFGDPAAELERLERIQRTRRLTESEAQRWLGGGDPEWGKSLARIGAAYVIDHTTAYPWQDAGVTLTLAENGVDVNDPVARDLATAAVEPDPTEKFAPKISFFDKDTRDPVGDALFAEDGESFIGFSRLSREENDLLVGQIEGAISGGEVSRSQINDAVRGGFVDPQDLLSAVSDYQRPYDELFGRLFRRSEGVPESQLDLEIIEFVNSLDYERVQELARQAQGTDSKYLPEGGGMNDTEVYQLISNLAHNEYSGFTWREEMRNRMDAAVPEAERELQERIRAAAEARGDVVSEEPVVDGDGGWFDTVKGWAGNVTRPTVALADYGRQTTVNRLRQNIGMMTEGLGESLAYGAGRPTGFQQPTVINQGKFLDDTTVNVATAAAGVVGTTMDLASVAAIPAAPFAGVSTGSAIRSVGAITLGTDFAEMSLAPDRWRERYEATDLGILDTNPELVGTGFLLNSDAVALRMDRERDLGPVLANGDLITFGRLTALGVGSFAGALENAPGGWGSISEGSPIGWFAEAANPGSEAYNVLSGLTDFAVAVAGPAELYADTMLVGIRNARALPGVRRTALIGNQDPFRAAGGISSSWRNTTLRASFDEWIGSSRGHRVAEALADLKGTEDVFRAFGGRITVPSARVLSELNTADGVSDFLRIQMGTEVQGVPRLGRVTGFNGTLRNVDTFGTRVRARVPGWERWSHNVPDAVDGLDITDIDSNYRWARDFLANGSIPRAEADEILEGLARTGFHDRPAYILNRVAKPVQERMLLHELNRLEASWVRKGWLKTKSADEAAALRAQWTQNVRDNVENVTRFHIDRGESLTGFHTDQIGGVHPNNPLAAIGDNGIPVSAPHLPIEAQMFRMPVPNLDQIRQIRRSNSAAFEIITHIPPARLLANPAHVVKIAGEWATNVVWKPAVLLRAAYVMRVVGEEQLRIAAAGGDALVNNPVGWFAWTMHKGIDEGIGDVRLSDTVQYRNSLVGEGRTLREVLATSADVDRAMATVYTTFQKTGDEAAFVRAWAGNLSKLSQDDLAREVAAAGGVTDELLLRMATEPELRAALDVAQMIALHGDVAIDLKTPDDLRRYLESIDERIELMTGGNADLRNAVATGAYGEVPVKGYNPGAFSVTDEFVDEITPLLKFAPDGVRGLDEVALNSRTMPEALSNLRRVLSILGAAIIEKPTSKWSRIPVFRQNYWSFIEKNADQLSAEAAGDILRRGIPAELPRDVRRTLEHRLGRVSGGGMSRQSMDMAARINAMEATNSLLYNMLSRNQFADASRLAAPFMEAWAEILSTWGRNVATNPNILRRFSQTKTVLEDPDFAESLELIPGFETVDGQGLIFANDYGQEMVIIPWANGAARLMRWAADKTGWRESSGLPLPPQAIPLNSINVGMSILPGAGPVMSVGLKKFMPEWMRTAGIPGAGAEVRDVLWPFGEPSSSLFDLPAELEPSWVRYIRRAFAGDSVGEYTSGQEAMTYIGKVNVAARWLAANDRSLQYDQAALGPAARDRLFEDARRLVDEMAYAQVFSSYFGPAPSSPQFWITDVNGDVQLNRDDPNSGTFISVITAANLFRAFRDQGIDAGFEFGDAENAAFLKLIEATGSRGSIIATIGASSSLLPGGVPVTRSAWQWTRDNPEAKAAAEQTWGIFASLADPDDDEFYQPMYWETIHEDSRERNSIADMKVIADDLGGSYLYGLMVSGVEQEMGMSVDDADFPDEVDDALGQYAQTLKEKFPNWTNTPDRTRGTPTTMAREIARVTAPDAPLGDHPLAGPLQEITATRQKLWDAALDLEFSNSEDMPLGVEAARGLRTAYDKYLGDMLVEHPGLAEFISRIYRAEIRAAVRKDREG